MMIAPTASPLNTTPNFRIGDERLIKVTASAAKKVRTLLVKQGREQGVLRVAVGGGGCSGLQYKMDLQDGPSNRDFVVETGGVKMVGGPQRALLVSGSELEYPHALQEGGVQGKKPEW